MKTTNITADLIKGFDFTMAMQAVAWFQENIASYATTIREHTYNFINTCWNRLAKVKKLTKYQITKFRRAAKEMIQAKNRYYIKLDSFYRLKLDGVELSRANRELNQALTNLYNLAS